jgi:iron(III) transport system permease protein
VRCGVAWNTLFLGAATAAGTTLLGTAFALMADAHQASVTRSCCACSRAAHHHAALRDRPGADPAVRAQRRRQPGVESWFGIAPGAGSTAFRGVVAQLLAFTPIAFMVLIGVVQGIEPDSLEEAVADAARRPLDHLLHRLAAADASGLANAFLVGFIESIADFGNPMVLGGNYGVLSTEIFFAIVGAQYDAGPRCRAGPDAVAGLRAGRVRGCSVPGSARSPTPP